MLCTTSANATGCRASRLQSYRVCGYGLVQVCLVTCSESLLLRCAPVPPYSHQMSSQLLWCTLTNQQWSGSAFRVSNRRVKEHLQSKHLHSMALHNARHHTWEPPMDILCVLSPPYVDLGCSTFSSRVTVYLAVYNVAVIDDREWPGHEP